MLYDFSYTYKNGWHSPFVVGFGPLIGLDTKQYVNPHEYILSALQNTCSLYLFQCTKADKLSFLLI